MLQSTYQAVRRLLAQGQHVYRLVIAIALQGRLKRICPITLLYRPNQWRWERQWAGAGYWASASARIRSLS